MCFSFKKKTARVLGGAGGGKENVARIANGVNIVCAPHVTRQLCSHAISDGVDVPYCWPDFWVRE